MSCKRIGWALLLSALTVALFACNRNKEEKPTDIGSAKDDATENAHRQGKPGVDWLQVQGKEYIPTVDELGRTFQLARTSFVRMDFQTAARETSKAAESLREQVGEASRQQKERIEAAIQDLDQLAQQLDHDSVESLDQLDAIFARAHQADLELNWVVLGVEHWAPMAQASDEHLRLAQQDLVQKNFKGASGEIRRAARLLKMEATRTTAEGRDELNTASQVLNGLAIRVENGSIQSAQSLDRSFAGAEYALADSYYSKALDDWAQHEFQNAGHELEASIANLLRGTEWTGRGAEFDSTLVVKEALLLSRKLIDGQAGGSHEVAQQIKSVGGEIEALKRELGSQTL
jgi:hypothetical protein